MSLHLSIQEKHIVGASCKLVQLRGIICEMIVYACYKLKNTIYAYTLITRTTGFERHSECVLKIISMHAINLRGII